MSMLRCTISIVFFSVVIGAPAVAQDLEETVLEEIVVTATRRAENIQSISVAVSAFDAEALRRHGIVDMSGLQALTPGFSYSSVSSDARPIIRGAVTNTHEVNVDPTVGIFIDGIYASRTSQATMPFVDIERVEVLRGPQGTLFGRNTNSGSVNIIPKRPTTEAMQYGFEVGFGDYSAYHVMGYANFPVNDSTAIRIAASKDVRDDGFVKNIAGPDYYDKDETFYRVGLSFAPSERFDANFMIQDFTKDDNGASTLGYLVIGSVFDTANPCDRILNDGTSLPINPRVGNGGALIGGVDCGTPYSGDPYNVDFNYPSEASTDSILGRAEFNWQLTNGTNLKFIGSYWDHEAFRSSENDFTSVPTAANFVTFLTEGETTQLEAHLSSAPGGTLDWLVGIFYYDDSQFEDFKITFEPTHPAFGAPPFQPFGHIFDRLTTIDTESTAGFGHVSWNINDQTRLIAGARYTKDDKDYSIRTPTGLAFVGGDFDASNEYTRTTWKAAVEYDLTDDNLLYFSASTGFRSGGFNRIETQPPFDNELSTSYEIGSKNEFLDNRLRLNLAAYYVDYDDYQETGVLVDQVTGQSLGSFFENVDKARSYGLEIEFQAVPTDALMLAGAFTFQDAEIESYPAADNPFSDSVTVDLSGNDRQNSPDLAASFFGRYDFSLGQNGILSPQLLIEYSDSYFTTQYNTALDEQDSFVRLDASLIYTSSNKNWQIEAFVKNATDEVVLDFSVFGGTNALFANYQAPRTYGIIVRADF